MAFRGIVLALLFVTLSATFAKDLIECPTQTAPKDLALKTEIQFPAESKTKLIRQYRAPASGLFPKDIYCIRLTDKGKAESVGIVGGGLHQKFVEFKFTSPVGEGIQYDLEIFTN